jgi:hypothetical protein
MMNEQLYKVCLIQLSEVFYYDKIFSFLHKIRQYGYRITSIYSDTLGISHAICQHFTTQSIDCYVHVNIYIPLHVKIIFILFFVRFTTQLVQDQKAKIWSYERYALVRDYYFRPPLCPPFTIIFLAYDFCKWLYYLCLRRTGTFEYKTFSK